MQAEKWFVVVRPKSVRGLSNRSDDGLVMIEFLLPVLARKLRIDEVGLVD